MSKRLIYAEDAIEAVKERYWKYGRFAKIEELVWSIEKLPPAQPEIIRCKDCVWWDNCPASTIAPTYHRCKRVGRMAMEERDYCSYAERKEDE